MGVSKTYNAESIAVHMAVEVSSEDMYQKDQKTVFQGW